MRLLLDTHALYWYIEGSSRLSSTAEALIRDSANEIFLSPASYWEMAIKISIGKWAMNQPYEQFIDVALNRYGFNVLQILPTHTKALIQLPFHHRDPFDRLLVAQAQTEQIDIVSNDPVLDGYGVTRHW